MKAILIILICLSFISCKKEILSDTITGSWYFIKANETDSFDEEYDFLTDYENITITFREDKTFVWQQDNIDYPGTYTKSVYKIKLNFDNSDQEVWENYNFNKNKNTLSYTYYKDKGSYFQFKLKKITTNFTRR